MYLGMSVGMSRTAISQNPLQSLPGDVCHCTCTCQLVQINLGGQKIAYADRFSLSHTLQVKEEVVLAIIAVLSFYTSFSLSSVGSFLLIH